MLAGDKILFQTHQNRSSSNFIENLPNISVVPCSAMQKIVCPSYEFCDLHKRGLLELWEKVRSALIGWLMQS